jgi:PHD/YefM family antitoxin component YafN of YafNO toxin-antitoxin module
VPAIEVAAAASQLGEIAAAVAQRGDRVTLLDRGVPLAVMVRPYDLRSLVETIELLSDHDVMRRVAEGEAAFLSGDVLAGSDLVHLDPEHRHARPGSQRTGGAAPSNEGPWDLVVSGPAGRSFGRLPPHIAGLVRTLLFERFVADPMRYGVELRGSLSRRFASRVETEIVIYRLDSVKRTVRVIEILHGAGRPGERVEPGRHW